MSPELLVPMGDSSASISRTTPWLKTAIFALDCAVKVSQMQEALNTYLGVDLPVYFFLLV
jgi:hypothetical protein